MDRLLLLTGSMGSGKTTALGEASDLLTQAGISHAAVDLDALAVAHVADVAEGKALAVVNLVAVCANYRAAGIRQLLLAAAVESHAELEQIVRATGAATLAVCRLRASVLLMQERVAAREQGVFSERYVSRVPVLEEILDAAVLEDFSVHSHRHITDVAREILLRAQWIDR